MAPHAPGSLQQVGLEQVKQQVKQDRDARTQGCDPHFQPQLLWHVVVWMTYAHAAALYAVTLLFTHPPHFETILLGVATYVLGALGITTGAHRLFSHRSYRANAPLRALLTALGCLAFQKSCIEWARDHRVHHKYSETDADPHNANRGFFFSHIGWVLCKRHPDCAVQVAAMDVSDLTSDPILVFQHKYYMVLMPVLCFLLPSFAPVYLWGEAFSVSWHLNVLRYVLLLHATFFVNSYAHMFGNRPYDKYIGPGENLAVAICSVGEGWHNFHHAFPWDYRCAELGGHHFNLSTAFIRCFARLGWASHLRTASDQLVRSRAQRTGDGSRAPS